MIGYVIAVFVLLMAMACVAHEGARIGVIAIFSAAFLMAAVVLSVILIGGAINSWIGS